VSKIPPSEEANNSQMKDKKVLFLQINMEKERLDKKEKFNKIIASSETLLIIALLLFFDSLTIKANQFTSVITFTEVATSVLIAILFTQFYSLKGEIEETSTNKDMLEAQNILFGNNYFPPESLSKIFDVRKNTIDKLFDKLGTFSNTWLVVTGGVASSLIVAIFESNKIELYPSIAIIMSALLLWNIAQSLYGILDYELMKKTKDLANWWITLL
jgi:hypothetical protein